MIATKITASARPLPTWLVSQLVDRGHTMITLSETPDEFAARILRETGERWDAATQQWIKV